MNLVVSWYKTDVKKQRFQVRYWVVSNIFIFLYISREKFVEKFSKCCENGIACLRKGKLRCRQRRQATAKNSSQASDQRIFDTVNTLFLMRNSTEFTSEISAPRISTSFEFHLDFLVNLGEVGVYHVCMCMCFIVLIPCLVTPRHRFVMMH